MRRLTTLLVVLLLCGPAVADTAAPRKRPAWPQPVLATGEQVGKTMFGEVQHWIGKDGVPVAFHHVIRADGKGVLRAFWADKQQDVLVHDFGADELIVIHRDDGELGFQFHRYVTGAVDRYLGVRARWTGTGFKITKQKRFHGKQPTPPWLFEATDRVAPPLVAFRTMARGSRSSDAPAGVSGGSAFTHYFDAAPVTVKWSGAPEETIAGTALTPRLVSGGLPLLGFGATCDRQRCCTADIKSVAAWDHVTKICFSEGAEPRVRLIEIVKP